MSGCSYTCLVYPQPSHVAFRPSLSQVATVVRGMMDAGWVESKGAGWRGVAVDEARGFVKVQLQPTTLEADLERLAAVAHTFTLELNNGRDAGDPTPFEEDASGIFRPEYCEDAYLFLSTVPVAVEDPHGTDTVACAQCGANVLAERCDHPEPAIAKAMLLPRLYAPERCPHCSTEISLQSLSMALTTVVDGPSPRLEAAPFFHFALWLLPVEKRYPDTERVLLDDRLLRILEDHCAIPFRSVGTLACS